MYCCVIGYGITLKVSKSKYKICYHFMGSSLIFQLLYINVLNYRQFHTDSSTFLKINNVGKFKKTLKRVFIEKFLKSLIRMGSAVSDCVFVWQQDNSWAVRDRPIITKFTGHHPTVEMADKFENCYCGMRRWWENVVDVLVFISNCGCGDGFM